MCSSLFIFFHFVGPFLTDIISSIILIIQQTRQQTTIYKQQKYREIIHERLEEHKQILIAPVVLVITFASECMESNEDPWLFLIAYFITFIVFVLTSEFYKSIQQIRKTMRQRSFT